jgi:hypothetical protein
VRAVAKLSRALGVTVEDLFAGVGWQQEPPRLLIEDPIDAEDENVEPPRSIRRRPSRIPHRLPSYAGWMFGTCNPSSPRGRAAPKD